MAGKNILILGGGFGGLSAAQQLRRELAVEHKITLVEKKNTFYMCSTNMRLMAGEAGSKSEGERNLSELAVKGINWVQAEVTEIVPSEKRVQTTAGSFVADYLVVALGAEKDWQAIPGFSESAHNLYDANEALRLHKSVQEFASGKVVVLVSRTPYSCPGAPYEAAFQLDWAFRTKGNRDKVEIAVYTPEPRPMPSGGEAAGKALLEIMKERDIKFFPQHKIQRIESASRKLVFENAEANFDLLVGVPPHSPPKVVKESRLADETGWVPVEIDTLETSYRDVFAIGDITTIKQPNPTGMPLPKAGVFADEQGRVVAANIAARIRGEDKVKRFDGRGFCYVEMGDNKAAYASGNFYGYPAPNVYLEAPSKNFHDERKRLEKDMLEALV